MNFKQRVISRDLPLISIGTNAKTIKSDKSASVFKTAIMYLSPADTVPGMNLCPMAEEAGCKAGCLNTAGRGAFSNVQKARIMKTLFLRDNPAAFMALLVKDIERELRKANKKGYTLAIRLNGTSDIVWENIPAIVGGKKYRNIFAGFPGVTFYDYTKNISPKRALTIAGISNYSVTASYSEASAKYAAKIAKQDQLNIAVVFRESIPAFYTFPNGKTLPVINGDISDERYLDPTDRQYVVGLLAKGKAKNDESGFVIDQPQIIAIAA